VFDAGGGGYAAWKVSGTVFACTGAIMPGVAVKTDNGLGRVAIHAVTFKGSQTMRLRPSCLWRGKHPMAT
jgi:hypothetical protein